MAKVTWLGQGEHGPDQIIQWSITFKKDEAVEVTDPSIVVRAQDDPFFKVEADEPATTTVAAEPGTAPAVEYNK